MPIRGRAAFVVPERSLVIDHVDRLAHASRLAPRERRLRAPRNNSLAISTLRRVRSAVHRLHRC